METKVLIGLLGQPETFREIKRGVRPSDVPVIHEKITRPARILSRISHAVTLSYNGQAIVIPPNGQVRIADYEKLGSMPSGIVLVKE